MKLELIVPATRENLKRKGKALCPPLGLAMIGAVTPRDIDINLIDENISAIDFDKEIDLAGITTLTITAQRAYQIADILRTKGVKTVLGGIHASALPEEAGRHADAVVIGEAEGIWPKVIQDFKANNLQKTYRQSERPKLFNLPIPRRDLFNREGYRFGNTVSTTRGCPNACSFCSVTSFFGRTHRFRPVSEVIKEIETLNKREILGFVDDNAFVRPAFARELMQTLGPLKKRWIAQASVSLAKDFELLRLAAASGCVALLIGFETLSPANLAALGKRVNVVDEYESVIQSIHSQGIAVHGFFILGLDGDDEDVFERTLRFAQKMRLESAQFIWPIPYPGTALCESLDKSGRIITKDWSLYESEVVFEPQNMSRETLKKGCFWVETEFYSLPSIWRRIGPRHRNSIPLWVVNLSMRSFLSEKAVSLI